MKNILTIENGIAILLSNVDDGTNTIFINGAEIPASSWVGSGVYQYTESGVTFTIQKTNANTGNIMLQLVQGTAYRLVKQFEGEPYNSGDPLDTDLVNEDYMPFYDASDGKRKNSLWSNIVAKIKTALGIVSSGTTFLRKDGAWATPTNTTYTFATGDSNGQIKVTPSGGTAQNVSVKGLGTAAYTASTVYAVSKTLTNEDLNNVTTPGFYNAGGQNTCTNTGLASGTAFGLEVVHTAAGSYYWQIINPCGTSHFYRRVCSNGTWGAWTQDNYTNTWRGIQNNLTSTSTTDSLSAAQGKVLQDSKVAKSGDTMTGRLYITRSDGVAEGLTVNQKNGTTSTVGSSSIVLGNSTASGTAENSRGVIAIYTTSSHYVVLYSTDDGNQNGTLYLPTSKNGKTIFTTGGGTMDGILVINRKDGTASAVGNSGIILGNSTASGTAENSRGYIRLYSEGTGYMDIRAAGAHNGNYILSYQSKSGTIALTSDIKTYTASRGIGINNSNEIYIKGWSTFTATALNASGNVTFRYIQNFCFAYQTYFAVSRTSAASAQLVTIDGSEYYYAPLFSLTADQATGLVGSNLPTTNGENTLFARHENGRQYGSSVWRIYRKTASVYYILDETMRVTKASGTAGLNSLIDGNYWHFSHVGVLFFIYN